MRDANDRVMKNSDDQITVNCAGDMVCIRLHSDLSQNRMTTFSTDQLQGMTIRVIESLERKPEAWILFENRDGSVFAKIIAFDKATAERIVERILPELIAIRPEASRPLGRMSPGWLARLRQRFTRANSRRRRGYGWPAFWIGLFAFLIVSQFTGKERIATAAPGQAIAQQAALAPPPSAPSVPRRIDPTAIDVLYKIAPKTGIAFGDAAALAQRRETVFVFSDPNCPHCRNIEPMLEQLAKRTNVVVMPVAYQLAMSGKAQAVMCKTGDRHAAWTAATQSPQSAQPQPFCDEGRDIVTTNMRAFEGLGFTSTPTLVSSSGSILVGEGYSPDDAAQLLQLGSK